MSFLLSLIKGIFGLWLSNRTNTAESLGKAEEKASVMQKEVDVLNQEAAAAKNTPTSKTEMEKLLEEGKL